MHTQKISPKDTQETKKKILSIVKKLEPIELKSLEHYAEYLVQRSTDLKLLTILSNSEQEDEDLDKSEIEGLKISKREFKEGKFRELKD